jgi:heteromeric Ino2p/Ino4p transcription factor
LTTYHHLKYSSIFCTYAPSLPYTPLLNLPSSAAMANNNAAANFADKPRLTEQEKKNNHIASEQKRRQAIREGFDRLAEIVPTMSGQGRSEAVMLSATVTYMRSQLAKKDALKEMAAKLNVSDGDFEQMYREERARINQSYDRS